MNILFMGTPEFAVPTLKTLITSNHKVVGVFTQPDKPVGRKQILTPPPVKVCALEYNIPVFQPKSLKNGESELIINDLSPDIIVVVAYGKILPKSILDVPKYGCVNGHASLLPRHRGASPIQWSIVCGDKKTGVTTMLMGEGLDTGDMLSRQETEIGVDETAGELHDRLSQITAVLMLETIEKLEKGEIVPIVQDDSLSTYAPIITKDMGFLKFDKTAEDINNLIRGFSPWPNAYFYLNGKRIKVHKAKVSEKTDIEPATIIKADDEFIISCADYSSISLIEIQPEGSKRMTAKDYLKGHSICVGDRVNGDLIE